MTCVSTFHSKSNTVGGSHISAITLVKTLKKHGVEPVVTIHQQGPVEDLLHEHHIPFEIIKSKFVDAPGGGCAILQLPRIIALSEFFENSQC